MRAFIEEGQKGFQSPSGAQNSDALQRFTVPRAGGGYEITLACDYRVASDDPATRIGLPETSWDLFRLGAAHPIAAVDRRETAAEVILKGKLYSAKEALKLGLVDEIAPRDQLLDRAREKLPRENANWRTSSRRDDQVRSATRLSAAIGNPAPRTRLRNYSTRHWRVRLDESSADGARCDCRTWQNRINAKSDSQFFPR